MSTAQPTYDDILRLFQETDRRFQDTDRQLKEIALLLKETALLLRKKSLESDLKFQETDRQLKEIAFLVPKNSLPNDPQSQETDFQIQGLKKQISELGAKFGGFTEGLALPSMEIVLQQRFGITAIMPRAQAKQNGAHLEIDVLAYARGDINAAFLVEVKGHPQEEAIGQLKTKLNRFRDFFPGHGDKQLYGILAAVDWSDAVKAQAMAEGLYVARIHDDVFDLEVDQDFYRCHLPNW